MKKLTTTILLILAIIVVILTARFIFGGNEDDWICVNDQWIEHGAPSSPAPASGCGDQRLDCQSYSVDNCPSQCVVCPPCIECSSISCQTEKFCEDIGIDRKWYENIKKQTNLIENCGNNQGKWLGEFKECEYIDKDWCDQYGGKFMECESACRHNPEAEICTMQCVPVCKFSEEKISSFQDCVDAGNEVMESYPRQCRAGDKTFTEEIGNELEKTNLIQLDNPRPNQTITSPLTITGRARGTWFFEGDFPIVLVDWDGLIIAQGIARAKTNWMTEDFVEFTSTLEFEKPNTQVSNRGGLILQKDNPSGLPENDDALEIPILFK